MPLVKIPAIKAPSVSLYIRISDEKGRRHYERVRPRSPQPCVGPMLSKCHCHVEPVG